MTRRYFIRLLAGISTALSIVLRPRRVLAVNTPQYTTNIQYVAPSAADGAAVSSSGTTWGSSAWVQVIASAATGLVLTGVIPLLPTAATSGSQFEIDIGTGAAASEVVIATVSGSWVGGLLGLLNGASENNVIRLPIPIDNIASGARVAIRIRTNSTNVNAYKIAITYYQKPIVGTLLTTANALLVSPSAASLASVTSGGGTWTNGSWVQLIASTAAAIVIPAVNANFAANTECEWDIGTGGAGSEVVVTTVRSDKGGRTGGPSVFLLQNPLDNIPISTRVSVRSRASSATQGSNFGIMYYQKPL